jgi:hypothetical protein
MVYPNPQIYHHLGAIFVHVPKTGGTSIEMTLRESPEQVVGGHTTALGYRRKFPEEFRDYFTFAVVRHPLDRFLSAWRYLRARPLNENLKNVLIHECDTFPNWLTKVREDPALLERIVHLHPQHRFVCDEGGGVLVDRLYRYEALDEAWSDIAGRLGLGTRPLPRWNCSPTPQVTEIPGFFAEWIAETYAQDFALGGYEEMVS